MPMEYGFGSTTMKGGGGVYCTSSLLALVVRPSATHPFRDGATMAEGVVVSRRIGLMNVSDDPTFSPRACIRVKMVSVV